MKKAKNPYQKIWEKEEKLHSADLSQKMTTYLRSGAVQKQIDKAFGTTNSAEQIDWKSKEISKATKIYQRELDRQLKRECRSYPGLYMKARPIRLGKVKRKFLPTVTIEATYVQVVCGGFRHTAKAGDTYRTLSKKYYYNDIYWDVIHKANPFCWFEGYDIDIPVLNVLADHGSTKAKCGSGGMTTPAKIAYPEFTADFSKTVVKHTQMIPIAGMPFTIILEYTCTGSLNIAKTGTIPLSFNVKEYQASATKTIKGLNFDTSYKSRENDGLMNVGISGAGGKWSFALALEDGNKLKASVAPKPIKTSKNGFTIIGKIGFSVTATVKGSSRGLKIGTPKMAKELALAPIYLAAAALMFVAFRGLNPATASSMMINNGPSSGIVGYDEAHQVI